MKKNIYLAQINYLHGKSTFLPYAAGTLIANACSNKELFDCFNFKELFFLREPIDTVLEKIDRPFLFGFSNYIWNHEYNKVLAQKIKERFPECIILFGGHHITPDTELMEKESYIDIMCFGEGEEVFENLLVALENNYPLDAVNNIAFRKNGKIHRTPTCKIERIDYPSPYLTGVFDSILEHYPNIDFHAITETNRGCPYNCAYCDWGNLKSKVRFFPEEKVMRELKWFSDHNISGFGCADSNFGMFERDERFIDEIVRLHNEYGVLSRFQTSYAKNSNDRVFRISQKLNKCGMDKGATLSFQSLNPVALENINRKNITVDTFSALLNKYNENGIATYSELIIGLPGETVNSFIDSIDTLLNAGQHSLIYIHNCEWLPCALMGNPDYIRKHKLRYVTIPLNEPHTLIDDNDNIPEFSRLIVETYSMSRKDWVDMNVYATTIQCFHHEGLLLLFALYLHYEKGLKYSDFYNSLIKHLLSATGTSGEKTLTDIKSRFEQVANGDNTPVWTDNRFGNVGWPPEEIAFLKLAINIDSFYDEISGFIKQFFDDDALFNDLLLYQKSSVKLPFKEQLSFDTGYNFKNYFSDILCGNYQPLVKVDCKNTITRPVKCSSWEDYARHIIWYEKKESRNIYLQEIEVIETR